jgi:hypothetical protein
VAFSFQFSELLNYSTLNYRTRICWKGVIPLSDEIELEIFRAGDYGEKGSFLPDDLEQIARDYDPALHEAPVTVDHSQSGPAFGWIAGLKRVGDALVARLKDLSDDFRAVLRSGAFKKPSIELYRRFSQTGRPYLRALSFLGARPPEVKGLAQPTFGDQSDFVTLDAPDAPAKEPSGKTDLPCRQTEPAPQNHPAPSADRFAEIAPEVIELRQQNDRLERELAEIRASRRRADIILFCEEAKRSGRLLPAWEKLGIIEFLQHLDDAEAVSFAEGAEKQTPLQWFKTFLRSLPPLVPLKEIAVDPNKTRSTLPSVPSESDRAPISPVSLELHRKVLIFQEQNPGTAYADALRQVAR